MNDALNLLKKITWRRFINALFVYFSYQVSKKTGRFYQKGFPISISVEPTTSCNLRCPECPSGLRSFARPTGMLEQAAFQQMIDQTEKHLLYLTLYFQGEPYLNPEFLQMVKYAASKKIYTATSTNAHFLTDDNARKTVESGLDRLIISIDGTTQKSYEAYRKGGKLDKVIEGTRNIVKWKKLLKSKTPHVIFQFLVVRANEHQVDEVKALGEQLEVDKIVFKTAQIYNYEEGSDLLPLNQKYSRYKKVGDNKWILKNSLDNNCWKMWHSSVITWDGKVLPCCFDKDGKYEMGNISSNHFSAIWKNKNYNTFRKTLMQSRKSIEMCRNCTEGTKVWA